MNRRRIRMLITLVVILALVAGIGATLVVALRGQILDSPVTLLPGVTLTPEELADAGLGTATAAQYAPSSFVFFPGQTGEEQARVRGGVTVVFGGGEELTFLGGRFPGAPDIRDQAYVLYRSKAADAGLVDDQPPTVIGRASARYEDSSAAAILVCADDTVFTLLYTRSTTDVAETSSPLATSIEAVARLILSRL